MNIDYDSAIAEFLEGVKTWLDQRPVRDSTDALEVRVTKNYWQRVSQNTRFYVQPRSMCSFGEYGRGFIVRTGFNAYNTDMYLAVLNMMYAMDRYYKNVNEQAKAELANAIKKYKMLRAKNAFERLKISLTKSEKLLATKQK